MYLGSYGISVIFLILLIFHKNFQSIIILFVINVYEKTVLQCFVKCFRSWNKETLHSIFYKYQNGVKTTITSRKNFNFYLSFFLSLSMPLNMGNSYHENGSELSSNKKLQESEYE